MPLGELIGSGAYNDAYKRPDGTVLKIPKTSTPWDKPKRAVRLWNELNGDLVAHATLFKERVDAVPLSGWLSPYIDGEDLNDNERRDAVIDFFNKTGRIIFDGCVDGNIKKDKSGAVVCVDVGLALYLDSRESRMIPGKKPRRKSIVSLKYFEEAEVSIHHFFDKFYPHYPLTVQTVKALLLVQNVRPNYHWLGFLKKDLVLMQFLSFAYDAYWRMNYTPDEPGALDQETIDAALAMLDMEYSKYRPLTKAKQRCARHLEEFIVFLNKTIEKKKTAGRFPLFVSKNDLLIKKRVETLMQEIDGALNLEEVKTKIEFYLASTRYSKLINHRKMMQHYLLACLEEIRGVQRETSSEAERTSLHAPG